MNNRIRELMLEAGYAAPEIAGRANKLAELIIRECVDIANNVHMCRDGKVIAEDIKQHFGVEQ